MMAAAKKLFHCQLVNVANRRNRPVAAGRLEKGRRSRTSLYGPSTRRGPSEGWIAYPVNRRVNSPKNDDAKLIEPEPA